MNTAIAPSTGLRKMTRDDLPKVLSWRNHPEIRKYMYSSHEISTEEHIAWFTNMRRMSDVDLLIFELDGAEIGYTKLDIFSDTDTAEWGFYVSPDAPKGTGTRLANAVLTHAFERLKLQMLKAEVLTSNARSIQFHEKMGFKAYKIGRRHHCQRDLKEDIIFLQLNSVDFANRAMTNG